MRSHPGPAVADQRGTISVLAVFFSLVIGGLSITMIEAGLASRRLQARGDSFLYALEAAETGTALAEQELTAQNDPGGDGIGNVSGSYGGLRYQVTATQDPEAADRYTLLAQGWHGKISRRIETCATLIPGSPFNYGLFARDLVKFSSSGAATDAYDSRVGTYASQATNTDAAGTYAQTGGSIGSNGNLQLNSQVRIRGNATPGPGDTISISNNATVTGSTAPMAEDVALPVPTLAEFQAVAAANDNGKWTSTGGVTYNAVKGDLTVTKNNTLTLTGKTYFFHSLTLTGGATIRILNGPVKIYITDQASMAGGVVVNETNRPFDLQFIQHPYALPVGATLKNNTLSVSGNAKASFVVYAPGTDVALSGNSHMFGSAIGRTISVTGGGKFHFDLALNAQMPGGRAALHRLYWRDLNPPLR